MQPRSTKANEDPCFDWAKAFSKFQRNLFKMFIYGDSLVDETMKKWESENTSKKDTKQDQGTKRQQSTNDNQRSTNSRQQTAASDSKPANGNPKPANGNPQPEKQPDSAEKTKVIEGARELFKHLHTNAVADELNIKKEKIFTEAQQLWGPSDDWTLDRWEEYIKAIADFHNRQGVIYDNLKPADNASDTTETKAA